MSILNNTSTQSLSNGPSLANSLLNTDWYNNLQQNASQLGNSFYYEPGIFPSNWDQNFPYELLILQLNNNTNSLNLSDNLNAYSVLWKITLPFSPESLEIMSPFAISNQVTFNGIVEEHAGMPIKQIMLKGTMGVVPGRGTTDQISSSSSLSSIFAGTVQGLNFGASAAKSLLSPTGLTTQQPNIYKTVSSTTNVSPSDTSTLSPVALGFTQFHLLRTFLENYAFEKQNKANINLRLAFACWKDGLIYLVTPVSFLQKRIFNKPLEYLYELKLKAWKRISLSNNPGTFSGQQLLKTTPNFLQTALNKITQSQAVLQSLIDTVNGVAADADKLLFSPIRQLTFTVTLATRAALTIGALPASIMSDLTNTIISSWGQLSTNFSQLTNNSPNILTQQAIAAMQQAFNATFQNNSNPNNNLAGSQNNTSNNQGFLNISSLVSPIFNNPDKYYDFFSNIKLAGLPLSAAQNQAINNAKRTVSNPSVQYYQNLINDLQQFSNNYANLIGQGNSAFNNTYNVPNVAAIKTANDNDFQILYNVNAVIEQLYQIVALMPRTNTTSIPLALQQTANLANQNNITFELPISKFPVPFAYGITLERLAVQYLGDANRWIEIATLNNLSPPYIDEVGFDTTFVAVNAEWNQGAINNTNISNLYIGQSVWLESNKQSPLNTIIESITAVNDNYYLITFDTSNVINFDISGYQSFHAFLPGTVNSFQYIYIPSQDESNLDLQDELIPGVNNNDNLLAIGGVDLLLTPSNDLVITTDGAGRLAFGLNNIIQTVRIIISTPQGALLQHPQFGLGIPPGSSLSDISAQQLLQSAKTIFTGDPAFTGVQNASILVQGPVTQITLSVALKALNKLLPITVNLLSK